MSTLPLLLILATGPGPFEESAVRADTLPEPGLGRYVGTHSALAELEWRFDWDPEASPAQAFVALWRLYDDPDRDDRIVARVVVDGLTVEGSQVVFLDQGSRTVCAVAESGFWTGYGLVLEATGDCELEEERGATWVNTERGLEKRTVERIRIRGR